MMGSTAGIAAPKASKVGSDFDLGIFCAPELQILPESELKKLAKGPLRTTLQEPNDHE